MTEAATPSNRNPVPELRGPDVWYGSEVNRSASWIRRLTAGEIREIHLAVGEVERKGLDIAGIERADFPLLTLAPELARIREELLRGRGFALIRGLPVEGRSMAQIAIAFWGIGAHLGEAISQNAKGHLLGHVKDIGHDPHNPEHRLYATRARHRFHADSCDLVGLFCVRPAKEGGLSSISSSATIYSEMRRRRPKLAELLSRPIFIDRKGEIPEGKDPWYRMPVFNHHAGYVTTYYARDFFDGAQRHEGVPPISREQTEAMDLFEQLAERPDIRLDMELEPGDMQFVHNHQIVHSRTVYQDHPEPERKRHLLRLWLSASDGRELPPAFGERYGNITLGSKRGGIVVPGTKPYAPLEAEG